ncbi:MAG: hypothetical protein COT85_06805 [Chlamydiae bacterium CG10_big_fil_rev_8_21_14_0_10_42_34]|nr:MAG: hypothetical protein COT85_06805 [Chlamydiae bacterium CG10_big_fil_rev_8_21_14_0_10_42_34]
MTYLPLLINFLAAEVSILLFLIIVILIHRLILYFKVKFSRKRNAILSQFFLNLLEKNTPFDINNYPGKKSWKKLTLEIFEAFDRRLKGDEWVSLKNKACEVLLLDTARKWAKSIFWLKRNFAARVFAIYCLPIDEPLILKLMDDHKFLIRSPASLAAIHLESSHGVEKILHAISDEYGFAQFFYRDALLSGSTKVLEIMTQLATNPILHKTILDILGSKSWGKTILFLKNDLISSDPEIHYLALRALIRNLLPDSYPYFHAAATNENPKIRAVGIEGLSLFLGENPWEVLEKALQDPVWAVRVEAGKTLKSGGEKGLEILKRQENPIAKEAANYALVFG